MEMCYKDDNAKNQRFYGQQLLSILTFLIIITNDNQTKILLNQMRGGVQVYQYLCFALLIGKKNLF